MEQEERFEYEPPSVQDLGSLAAITKALAGLTDEDGGIGNNKSL